MQKNYILFDLDGTLTDPMVGITRSVQYALAHYGIREPDLTKLTPFIGPPLKEESSDVFSEFTLTVFDATSTENVIFLGFRFDVIKTPGGPEVALFEKKAARIPVLATKICCRVAFPPAI